jgi:hypothetical protein
MVFISKGKISKGFAALLTVVASLSILRDLKITQFTFTTGNPHITFGLGHELLYLSKYDSLEMLVKLRYAGGFAALLICFGASYLWLRNKTIAIIASEGMSFARNLYVFSTTLILTCYLSGANADYRLIFLCVSGITFLTTVHISEIFSKVALHVIFGILWLTYPSGDYEIFGDALLTLYVGFTGAFVLKIFLEKKLTILFK